MEADVSEPPEWLAPQSPGQDSRFESSGLDKRGLFRDSHCSAHFPKHSAGPCLLLCYYQQRRATNACEKLAFSETQFPHLTNALSGGQSRCHLLNPPHRARPVADAWFLLLPADSVIIQPRRGLVGPLWLFQRLLPACCRFSPFQHSPAPLLPTTPTPAPAPAPTLRAFSRNRDHPGLWPE